MRRTGESKASTREVTLLLRRGSLQVEAQDLGLDTGLPERSEHSLQDG